MLLIVHSSSSHESIPLHRDSFQQHLQIQNYNLLTPHGYNALGHFTSLYIYVTWQLVHIMNGEFTGNANKQQFQVQSFTNAAFCKRNINLYPLQLDSMLIHNDILIAKGCIMHLANLWHFWECPELFPWFGKINRSTYCSTDYGMELGLIISHSSYLFTPLIVHLSY